MVEKVYFSLGSNLGDRLQNLEMALGLLERVCPGLEASRIYETEPMYYRRQAAFLNLAARANCAVSPGKLLGRLHAIEWKLGRKRGVRYGPRTVDMDILLFGGRRIETKTLTVPHPRLRERRFVLLPLLELEPFLADPASGEPYWKALLTCPPGGVYFHAVSRYTVRSLIPRR